MLLKRLLVYCVFGVLPMESDNIAVSIRRARLQAGFTQKDVASALGKGQTTVASWETGRSQPNAATIIFLANLFDVSSDYLLGISDTSKPPECHTISSRICCSGRLLKRGDEL